MYKIYKLTNLVNNKIYIGLTKNTIEERWSKHIQEAKRNDKFLLYRAIRKYGTSVFKLELIEDNLTLDQAYDKEQYYIQYFNSYYKNNLGYNMTLGGENAIQNCGEKNGRSIASDEMRLRAIELLQTTDLPQEEIARIVGYPGATDRALQGFVHDLNVGNTFRQEGTDYPIRKTRDQTAARGFRNGNCLKQEVVQLVIWYLENTNFSYTEIGRKVGLDRHRISDIDNCKKYTEIHNYKNNIRKECKLNDK